MWQTSGDELWRSNRCSDINCGSNRINFLGPKRLMKNQTFEKKGELSFEKKNVAFFSPIIEHENIRQVLFRGVYKVFWQWLCKTYHVFFGTLEVDRNKHFKKYMFSGDKNFGPFFPVLSDMTKIKKLFFKGHKLIWPILWN